MYAQLVLATNNDRLPPMWTPRHFLTYLRWAWMVEGASQYFSGQVSLYRPAVITRLRDGDKPKFPPSRRDAILLGGTIFDLLDRHAGPQACALLAGRLRREGPTAGLELAFDAHAREIEKAWRTHLDDILYPAGAEPGADPLLDTGEQPSPLDAEAEPAAKAPRARAGGRPARPRARGLGRAELGLRPGVRGPVRRRAAHPPRRRAALAEPRGASPRPRPRLRAGAGVRLRGLSRPRGRAGRRRRRRRRRPRPIQSARRAGDPIPGSEPGSGSGVSISASLSSFRASSKPASGTITSRGPAASMSGTSKPRVRRRIEGIPCSSRMFWTNSASAWLRPPVTLTSSPRANWGRTFRAFSCASVVGPCSRSPV